MLARQPTNGGEPVKSTGLNRIAVIVAVCALVGALAGIAGSAAAPSKSSKSSSASKSQSSSARQGALRRGPGGPGFGPGGPAVHSEAVVPNEDGTGFDTVTMDAGNLESIDGSKLTIKEGTDKATYKTVEIDVGNSPTVVRNHEKASLSDLKKDDNVRVVKGPQGTFVMAESDAFEAQERKQHRGFRHGRFGGPPPPGMAAPAAPPADDNGSNS
jgi:hypothetical protein